MPWQVKAGLLRSGAGWGYVLRPGCATARLVRTGHLALGLGCTCPVPRCANRHTPGAQGCREGTWRAAGCGAGGISRPNPGHAGSRSSAGRRAAGLVSAARVRPPLAALSSDVALLGGCYVGIGQRKGENPLPKSCRI